MDTHLRLRLSFGGALILLIASGVISEYYLSHAMGEARWAEHALQVVTELQGLSSTVHLAQRDARAFSLSGDAKIAARFSDERQTAMARFRSVRHLTSDNPQQQEYLDRLRPLLDEFFAIEQTYISAPITTPAKHVSPGPLTFPNEGQTIAGIENLFREMRAEERGLAGQRSRLSTQNSSSTAAFVAGGTLLGALLIALSAAWIDRDLRRRERAEAALRQIQEELERRVQERTADLSAAMASLEAEAAERRKAQEEAGRTEQRYRMLFENSPLPMEIFDPQTLAYLDVNKAAQELYGYSCEEFQRMTLRDLRPPEELPALNEFLETVKDADGYNGTFITRHKSGKLITIEARVRTIEFGGRRASLKLITDVTMHKRMEDQLRQAQKLEAVGRLAGGIAHDFNNLLTVILGYSDTMLREMHEDDPLRQKISEIQAAGRRAANLTSQLLAFSRKQILKPQVLDLNHVVSNISQMLRRLLGEDIQMFLHLEPQLAKVKADPTQLEQVIVNLAVNARDAMPEGGQLVIESHNIELNDTAATLQGVPPGSYVLLTVSDTGVGMDEKTKTRVFEPFFTTKEIGKGTGLGLSMVLGVVQQSGGAVTIYSEVGIGTTFKVYLPQLDAPLSAPVTQTPAQEKPRPVTEKAGANILLVEDEPSLRALAREVLREAGYVVIEASNGKEALKAAQTLHGQPDLLLTDVVMPEMSGLQLAEKLQKKWPELPVLYTSGYTDHALLDRNTLREDMRFLQKPYMPDSLLEQVASVLASKRDNSNAAASNSFTDDELAHAAETLVGTS